MSGLALGAYGLLGHKLFIRRGSEHEVNGTCGEIGANEPWSQIFPTRKLIPDHTNKHESLITYV